MIFATAAKTAITVLPISLELLDSLSHTGSRCGQNFYPRKEFSAEWMKASSKRRRDPLELELDPIGRPVVLLQPRTALRSVRIV